MNSPAMTPSRPLMISWKSSNFFATSQRQVPLSRTAGIHVSWQPSGKRVVLCGPKALPEYSGGAFSRADMFLDVFLEGVCAG